MYPLGLSIRKPLWARGRRTKGLVCDHTKANPKDTQTNTNLQITSKSDFFTIPQPEGHFLNDNFVKVHAASWQKNI